MVSLEREEDCRVRDGVAGERSGLAGMTGVAGERRGLAGMTGVARNRRGLPRE
ncbi:hypothetical protein [Ornithinibacillus scapharcae]|uniref:hypothetical protein n=1 Tax=Ornithinibacillus scapharcae TaxID=1147159 RepID=UPI001300C74B|nr:hypothetical protein [Ornithinibacillus scapharcae]